MRRLTVLLGVIAGAVVIAACTGPTTTTSVAATFTCVSAPGDAHGTPPTTPDISFSLDTPEWATTGSTITLANLHVSEASSTEIVVVNLGLTGLADFTQPGIPAQISHTDAMYNTDSDGGYPAVSTQLTGVAGSHATVVVTSLELFGFVGGTPVERTCTPTSATTIPLASILIH